jgi:hypothetical protein
MVLTRQQLIEQFWEEVDRLSQMDIEQTNNLEEGEQNNVVHRPLLVNMDGKLLTTLITSTIDKLPKFSGKNTENVNKWLTKITNELDLLKLLDQQKLMLIQTFLVDDARQWYINNLSSIATWSMFVEQIQKAFSSPIHQKLALKQVGSRIQGMDESVLHYYNEMMELFKTIEATMDDGLKVAYLKAGLKASLLKEVLRENPQNPKQFLEVAQAEEKLEASINTLVDDISDTHVDSLSAIKSIGKRDSSSRIDQQQRQRTPLSAPDRIRCYRCNKIGHIARNCFSKNY